MSPPDADERGTRDYNKRIDQANLHSDFSFVVTSAALGTTESVKRGQINSLGVWVGTRPSQLARVLPGTLSLSSRRTYFTNPTFARSMTLSC
jgi:hypothetical protein